MKSRVLVIEDHADSREALETLIKMWGHEVEEASTATAGLEKALESRPDVVLVDLTLPDLDGCEVAKRLRASADPPLLVALTGHGAVGDRERAASAGFDVFLLKPCSPDELEGLLADPEEYRGRLDCGT